MKNCVVVLTVSRRVLFVASRWHLHITADETLRCKSISHFVSCHDDVIKWKHYQRYLPFVRGIHRSPVRDAELCCSFFFYLGLNKRMSKQACGWWSETPSWSLWRHCNVKLTIETPYRKVLYSVVGEVEWWFLIGFIVWSQNVRNGFYGQYFNSCSQETNCPW